MKMIDLENTAILSEAKNAKRILPTILHIPVFIGMFLVMAIFSTLVFLFTENAAGIPNLIFRFVDLLIVGAFVLLVEGRSLSSMGFKKKNALPSYFFGALIGVVALSAALAIPVLMGYMEIVPASSFADVNWGIIALYLLGYVIQSASEETMLRGYFLVSLSQRIPVWVATIISSISFGLMHIFNGSFDIVPCLNTIMFGVLFCIMFLRFQNIWMVSGVHFAWNFFMGNFYGISVSGYETAQDTVFISNIVRESDIITGGGYGIEGSIFTTIVGVIIILLLLFVPQTKFEKERLASCAS